MQSSASLYEQMVEQIRAETRAELAGLLGLSGGTVAPTKRKPGPKPGKARKGKPGPKTKAKPVKAGKAVAGKRRTAADIERMIQAIKGYVSRNADQTTQQIGEGMGLSTKDLSLPMRKMVKDKILTQKGAKSAAKYRVK